MSLSVKRLDVLKKLAESRTEEAATALALARGTLDEQQSRLQELQRYTQEYRARGLPVSTALLLNRERFLSRLQEAEKQQRQIVERAGQAVQDSTQQWLERRVGEQKYDVLRSAAQQRDQRQQAERDQRQLDELALRRFAGTRKEMEA